MSYYRFVFAAFGLVAAISVQAVAQTPLSWVQAGTLGCHVDPSIGFLIVGHQPMDCRYTPANQALVPQGYEGAINTVGLDLGVSAGSALAWAVFSPTEGIPAGALAGEYVGVSGDLGIGLGAGANVLVGGSGRSFALQPLSLQGSVAINVVLGLSSLKLRPSSM
jgi:hypothetical protein